MSQEKKVFTTEVKQILDLMIHSVYSQKEIFLRELISNASDAIGRRRFEALTRPDLAPQGAYEIRLSPNKEAKTLSITDNGIGMSYDEVVQNLGTIAYSGSKNFAAKLAAAKEKPELIGQFGVGFYSAFMVADNVIVHTQKAGETEGVLWQSTGDGTYTIEKLSRADGAGTTITLKLKKAENEDVDLENPMSDHFSGDDFTETWTIKSVVKKYSDFIEYPIKMLETKEVPEKDADGKIIEGKMLTTTEDSTLNSQKALWLRPSTEITDEEHNDFYKHLSHDWQNPLEKIHYKAEGSQEFTSLMYIPSALPYDYYQRDRSYGLALYVKRVFILDRCEDLIPSYLRFVRGIVDSSDLPLNVSREILQKDTRLSTIRKAVIAKVLRHFSGLLEKNREQYEKIWKLFGSTLKEGIPQDYARKDDITKICLFHSSQGENLITLDEYIARMKPEQKDIYFVTGESRVALQNSPYLEKLIQKGYEVLFCTDPVDEWVMDSIRTFAEKNLVSITKEGLNLDSEEEKKEKESQNKDRNQQIINLLKQTLDSKIKEVKISDRLVSSPVCLVSGMHDPSAHMERLMKANLGEAAQKAKRILEVNPDHPVIQKFLGAAEAQQKVMAEVLLGQAILAEGSELEDQAGFSKQLNQLMLLL